MKKNFFENKQFYLFPPQEADTYKFEMMINNYGGNIVSNPNKKTDFLIAKNDKNIRVKNWIDITQKGENPYGEKDILNFLWLEECVKQNQIVQKHPMYMIFTTNETQAQFEKNLDSYANSNTESDTIETLKYSIDQVKNKHTFFDLTDEDKDEILNFFQLKDISFLRKNTFWVKDEYLQLMIQLYGGKIQKDAKYKNQKEIKEFINQKEIK